MFASLLVGLAAAVGAPGAKGPKADPPQVEGEWVAESYVRGGKEEDGLRGRVFRFADGKAEIVGLREALTYKTDPKADPPRIDLTTVGRDKEETIPGIYRRDGDALVICFPKTGAGARPTKFESPAGSDIVLLTLKRDKKKD
jgi:uncharacterized protein (TIGR03067 family)